MITTKEERDVIKTRLREVRNDIAEVSAMLEADDLHRAYGAAEQAQHHSWDVKSAIDRLIDKYGVTKELTTGKEATHVIGASSD